MTTWCCGSGFWWIDWAFDYRYESPGIRTTIIRIIGDSVHPHSHFPMATCFFSQRFSLQPSLGLGINDRQWEDFSRNILRRLWVFHSFTTMGFLPISLKHLKPIKWISANLGKWNLGGLGLQKLCGMRIFHIQYPYSVWLFKHHIADVFCPNYM